MFKYQNHQFRNQSADLILVITVAIIWNTVCKKSAFLKSVSEIRHSTRTLNNQKITNYYLEFTDKPFSKKNYSS